MTSYPYDQRSATEGARDARTERQSSLFWGLGVGALAGASAYALYAARRIVTVCAIGQQIPRPGAVRDRRVSGIMPLSDAR